MLSRNIKCFLVISKILLLSSPNIVLADGCIEKYPEKYGFGNSFYNSKEVNTFLITDEDKYKCFKGQYIIPYLDGYSGRSRSFPVICRGKKNIYIKGVNNPYKQVQAKTEFKYRIRLLVNKNPFSAMVICDENHPDRFKIGSPDCLVETHELICASDKSIFRTSMKYKLIGFEKQFTVLQERFNSISNKFK